jgi:hypothetical protein
MSACNFVALVSLPQMLSKRPTRSAKRRETRDALQTLMKVHRAPYELLGVDESIETRGTLGDDVIYPCQ